MMLLHVLRLVIVPTLTICFAGYGLYCDRPGIQDNNAPVVKISAPSSLDKVAPDMQIPYSISVSDKEDGESKFAEIPATEVFLSVQSFKVAGDAALQFAAKAIEDPPGFRAIRKEDCFNCHAPHAKVIGPTFEEIANKYSASMNIDSLADHVIKGSKGRWASGVMPAHPDLTPAAAKQIIRWLTKEGAASDRDYFRGTEGSFKIRNSGKSKIQAVLITAAYTDHGIPNGGASARSGFDRLLLKAVSE